MKTGTKVTLCGITITLFAISFVIYAAIILGAIVGGG